MWKSGRFQRRVGHTVKRALAPVIPKIDIHSPTSYNLPMGTLGQPTPVAEERDYSRLIIVGAVVVVIGIMIAMAVLLREPPKKVAAPSPYISQLKFSDFKMSAEENFAGATVSYIDGTITNTGDKTAIRVIVQVNFQDSMGQLAQREELPLRVIRSNGVYNEPVDMSAAPLAPGKSEPFRLTFDSISAQWNHQYPDIKVIDVTTK